MKAIIWAVALGSGTSGGVLAPLLIMGGGMGAALAACPAGGAARASGRCWRMCATMGGTMRSPLTATFFAVELTGNTHVLLPLIAACVTAHLVTVLLMRRSILTEKVARRGHHLAREYRVDPFTPDACARDHGDRRADRAGQHDPAPGRRLPDQPRYTDTQAFRWSMPTRRVLGIVDPPKVLAWRRGGKHRQSTLR